MATIYKITGGGQKVRENVQAGIPTGYVRDDHSDRVEKSGCEGQDFSTGVMWATDLETLQRWADGWAGCEVRLVEASKKGDA